MYLVSVDNGDWYNCKIEHNSQVDERRIHPDSNDDHVNDANKCTLKI